MEPKLSRKENSTSTACFKLVQWLWLVENMVPFTVYRHHGKIQDFDISFYKDFHIVVCGLDSIVARRWLNGMLMSLLEYNEDGSVDPTSLVPMVDGGTEGFKGNARVIIPTQTPCIECTLDLFPPQVCFYII